MFFETYVLNSNWGDEGGRMGVGWFDVLILLVWSFFPQIKHLNVICSHFQYYQVLENITFSWGDIGCNCLFIQTSFTLTQAYLLHIHPCGRKISPLDYSTVWIGENFSQQLEVCSAVNPQLFFHFTALLFTAPLLEAFSFPDLQTTCIACSQSTVNSAYEEQI